MADYRQLPPITANYRQNEQKIDYEPYMTNKISLKEFTEKYTELLYKSSKNELIEILLAMASNVGPLERQDFLSKLYPKKIEKVIADESILDEIREIVEDVEIRQHEEPDWEDYNPHDDNSLCGYEDLIEPLQQIFFKVEDLFSYGNYGLARKACEELFLIFTLEDDYGHSIRLYDLEDVDQNETIARYLRSIYLTESLEMRAIALLNAMDYVVEKLGFSMKPELKDIINISTEELPEFSLFLEQWIEVTRRNDKPRYDAWNREAIMLLYGLSGLEDLAKREGLNRPRIYLDWINGLINEKNHETALKVAIGALQQLPRNLPIRAAIADLMILCGDVLNNERAQIDGEWLSFEAKPDLKKLMYLHERYSQSGNLSQLQLAIDIIEKNMLRTREYKRSWEQDDFENVSYLSKNILLHAYFLSEQYDKAWELAKTKDPLGWSSSENPQAFFIAYFFILATKKHLKQLSPILRQFWQYALSISLECTDNKNNIGVKLEQMYENLILSSTEADKEIIAWCLAESEKRIIAIVSNQHRGAYGRAAVLTHACTQILALIKDNVEAVKFYNKIKNAFPRHYSFQSELKQLQKLVLP